MSAISPIAPITGCRYAPGDRHGAGLTGRARFVLIPSARRPSLARVWNGGCGFSAMCYNTLMSSKTLKDVLERIETWPAERQEDAARVLIEMEEQDARQVSISDSQLEEVQRRRATPHRKFLTIEQSRNHFSIKGA
jgi:hypothetical protein